jgi:hypothetical protein
VEIRQHCGKKLNQVLQYSTEHHEHWLVFLISSPLGAIYTGLDWGMTQVVECHTQGLSSVPLENQKRQILYESICVRYLE